MRNCSTRLLILFFVLVIAVPVMAQSTSRFSFQAVVRDSNNLLISNSNIGLRISITQSSPEGAVVYRETHTPHTNANGTFSVSVGAGSVVSGDIDAIEWESGPYFIVGEIDPAGGTNYQVTAAQQIMAVPYALYTENCDESQGLSQVLGQGNSAGSRRIQNVGRPTHDQDLVNRAYFDSLISDVTYLMTTPRRDTVASICANALPFQWRGRNYNATGTYFDTLEDICGVDCDSLILLRLTVRPAPAITLAGITSSVGLTAGEGAVAVLTPDITDQVGSLTYAWVSTEGADLVANNLSTATTEGIEVGNNSISLTVTATNECGTISDDANITIVGQTNPLITLNAVTGTSDICVGGDASFTASPASSNGTVTYVWSTSDGDAAGLTTSVGAVGSATPTAVGTYTYTVTATASKPGLVDAVDSKTFTVTVGAQPAVTLGNTNTSGATTFCPGSNVVLGANVTASNGTLSYEWKRDGDAIDGATNANYTATTAGDYTVTVTASNGNPGCVDADATSQAVTVTIDAPVVSISTFPSNWVVCDGSPASITLTAEASSDGGEEVSYLWSPATGLDDATTAAPELTTSELSAGTNTYTLTASATNANSCVGTAVRSVTVVSETPVLTLGSVKAAWTQSSTSHALSAQVSITVDKDSDLQLKANVSSSTPTGGDTTYAWSAVSIGGNELGTTATINPNTTITGTTGDKIVYLRVTYTSPNGCSVVTDTNIDITVAAACPAVTAPFITASATSVCVGATPTLTVNDATYNSDYTYTWSNSSGGRSITPTVNSTTTYYVRAENDCGNFAESNSIQVTAVSYSPTLTISPSSTTTSIGTNVNLELSANIAGGSNQGYSWQITSSNAASANLTATLLSYQKVFSADAAGSYTVRAVMTASKSGCTKQVPVTSNITVTATACPSITSLNLTLTVGTGSSLYSPNSVSASCYHKAKTQYTLTASLSASNTDGATISYEWGATSYSAYNMGRFSQSYNSTFGLTTSSTAASSQTQYMGTGQSGDKIFGVRVTITKSGCSNATQFTNISKYVSSCTS